MDTVSEIRADEWWQKHLGECGTCAFRQKYKKWDVCKIHGTDCENVSECDSWQERKAGK